ncbi:D-3-phosphoglycerate dehydrogenase [hydrothermal vent metagenome]|uniref:D-3-phosphoglycerate dehydrogenase n=1 Tax=hydrothermal vent metagenome TaxID=652676 RepID=A0A3B0XKA1_9ZZZZ
MYNIKTYNAISSLGLDCLTSEGYQVEEDINEPDAIMLRSFKMHDIPVASSVKAIGRAGAGVNNIPVDKMSERGIVVFNAPGANANAVKELVIAGMLIACRNLIPAWHYTTELSGSDEDVTKAVEAGKKKFAGFELPGKTLGVIGLGAIGAQVANAAESLGMNVIGYDPSITVQHAWQLSSNVKQVDSSEELFRQADFVTFHVPLIDATRNLLNAESIATMKEGAVILNFARDGIVDDSAVLAAINSGKIHAFVSDFPSNEMKGHEHVYTLPHLGASTSEAEDNCAVMIAVQLKDFLQNGNIKNSVNFPNIKLARQGEARLAIANKNRPDMLAQISHRLGECDVNIVHMANESRNDLAYTLIDLESKPGCDTLDKISSLDNVLTVRLI